MKKHIIDDVVVGTASCLVIGSALSVPFLGVTPVLITGAGIVAACVTVKVLSATAERRDKDNDQR